MKLEPVYLVAPTPEPEGMSRRGVLFALGAFLAGAAGGAVACYSAIGAKEEGETAGSGDPELERLRTLADRGSSAELLQEGWNLLLHLSGKYPDDAMLWHGLDRIVEAQSLSLPSTAAREMLLFAAAVVERSNSEEAHSRRHLVPLLKGR